MILKFLLWHGLACRPASLFLHHDIVVASFIVWLVLALLANLALFVPLFIQGMNVNLGNRLIVLQFLLHNLQKPHCTLGHWFWRRWAPHIFSIYIQ